ncbi:Fimbrin [Nosema bombycis CQ1]|uniref:Fimbrin n=1 Tax=Nosema bombycis (strain CQ1 / CVCC 102059) TaxID=578461 RepID=R0KXH0_NOSB1|nr:Fimbrin [Nosema bombycis CQ1]|eukprot:EOB14882.1 Fimbrin [Nosema bombycis CQ1]
MEGDKFEAIDTKSIENGLRRTVVHRYGSPEFLDVTNHEIRAYAEHIKGTLPRTVYFDIHKNVYSQLRDGIVLAYFLNHIDDGLVDINKIMRNLDMEKQNGVFEASTNLAYIIKAAKKCGICVVNLGPEDILFENRTLVLGLLWQLGKKSVTKTTNITNRPELVNLLNGSETLVDITNGGEDNILLRWVNYHLTKAHDSKCVKELKLLTNHDQKNIHRSLKTYIPVICKNFGPDLKDSKIYLLVLKQVASSLISDEAFIKAYIEKDDFKRAEAVVDIAEILDCKRFITPEAILAGDTKLNFLFMATVFDKHIGLSMNSEQDNSLKSQIEELSKENDELSDKIKILEDKLTDLTREYEQEKELSQSLKSGSDVNNEMHNKAMSEHEKMFKEFGDQVLSYSQKLGYKYNSEDQPLTTDKIMFTINALNNEIDKLRIENRELRQMNVIIDEIYVKLEKRIDEYLSKQKGNRKGCLDFFFCK